MLPHESIINDAEIRKRASVQLDCTKFHRSDALTLWKNRLIVGLGLATILIGLIWWLSGRWSGGNSPVFAPGEVASVHAAWETQCTACHDPGQAAGKGWGPQTFGVSHTPDSKCQECHAGPKHHDSENTSTTPTCAACHLEHRGRDAILTRHDDRYCTVCHANLASHFDAAKPKLNPRLADSKITSWATHPEFDLAKEDPGKLKFNHKLHLSPGMASKDGKPLMTFGQLDPAARARYGGDNKDSTAPVELHCASCHQTDQSSATLDAALSGRATGALMQPISYEQHCQACHPLTVKLPDGKPELKIPHRWQPEPLRDLLEGLLVSRAMANDPERLQQPPWKLPGKDDTVKRTVADWLAAVEREAVGSKKLCAECHSFVGNVGENKLKGLTIEPTRVPELWYKQSKFNHAAHRLYDCQSCHSVGNSESARDVAIPKIDNCKQCHGPAHSTSDGPRGGVRSSCVTCHYYHNGDHPRQGKGATDRSPAQTRSLNDFLRPNN